MADFVFIQQLPSCFFMLLLFLGYDFYSPDGMVSTPFRKLDSFLNSSVPGIFAVRHAVLCLRIWFSDRFV